MRSASSLSFHNLNVYVVGEVGHPKAKVVRIVHISDTRGAHESFKHQIPKGHILIHSGDFTFHPSTLRSRFSNWCKSIAQFKKNSEFDSVSEWRQQLQEIEHFFAQQPHNYKIFVPGCWESSWYATNSKDRPNPEKIQSILQSAIYLEDSWCQILGLVIYGTPWTSADDLRSQDLGFVHSKYLRHYLKFKQFLINITSSLTSSNRSITGDKVNNVYYDTYRTKLFNEQSSSVERFQDFEIVNSAKFSTAENVHKPNGFILPDINAVAAHWAQIPTNANIVITHMPTWRPELYSHIAKRVK